MTVNKKIADIKDYKLDYITRLFKSIRNKRFESYVIQRIWNQLNNINVKFVTQQYFSREDGKYALADLYLPQINLIVEIDELQHETNTNKILDDKRSNDIIAIADVDIQRVKIYKENREQYTLEEVNQQISNIVELIEQKIREKGENFIPWNGDFLSVSYHRNKACFRVSDYDYMKNIDDAATVFGTKAKHRGFQRVAGFSVPNKENYIVWLPAKINKHWENELLEVDEKVIIIEKPKNGKTDKHIENVKCKKEKRITFFKEKDNLGFNYYKFVGVFEFDEELTNDKGDCVWKKVNDEYKL